MTNKSPAKKWSVFPLYIGIDKIKKSKVFYITCHFHVYSQYLLYLYFIWHEDLNKMHALL